MKIKSTHFIATMILLIISQFSFSQDTNDYKLQIGINAGSFIAGDFDLTYDTTIGAELQYIFANKSKFHHFINSKLRIIK